MKNRDGDPWVLARWILDQELRRHFAKTNDPPPDVVRADSAEVARYWADVDPAKVDTSAQVIPVYPPDSPAAGRIGF